MLQRNLCIQAVSASPKRSQFLNWFEEIFSQAFNINSCCCSMLFGPCSRAKCTGTDFSSWNLCRNFSCSCTLTKAFGAFGSRAKVAVIRAPETERLHFVSDTQGSCWSKERFLYIIKSVSRASSLPAFIGFGWWPAATIPLNQYIALSASRARPAASIKVLYIPGVSATCTASTVSVKLQGIWIC